MPTNDPPLYTVVLAGGSGTRFWPRSRAARPKQFLRLGGERSLIQQTVDRLAGLVPEERVLVVTGEKHRGLVAEQLPALKAILAEPAPRDTAAAIGWATWTVARDAGEDALLAVLPSDHVIKPAEKLRAALARAAERARGGAIVTFGIPPTHASSAFGYVRKGAALVPGVFEVAAFEEKPNAETAARYLAGKQHAWNSGMFVFSAKTMKDELRRSLPKTASALDRIVAGDGRTIGIIGLDDVVVVQHGDATLVCKRDRVEDVKKLVQELEKRGRADLV